MANISYSRKSGVLNRMHSTSNSKDFKNLVFQGSRRASPAKSLA